MRQNVWNLQQTNRGGVREMDYARPWYRYGLELLRCVTFSSANRRVLDVGCGVGEFLDLLGRATFQAIGIDGNFAQIQKLQLENLSGAVSDLEYTLPFADGTFGLVTCLEVIEHIATAEQLLGEIARVLEPGGHLLITTPNFAFLNNRIHYLRGAMPFLEGRHLRFFTRTRLEGCLADAGFQIVGRNCYGVFPGISTIATRVLHQPARLWHVPPFLEGVLAYDLIYLARKKS